MPPSVQFGFGYEAMWRKVSQGVFFFFLQDFWNSKAIPDTEIILTSVQSKLILKKIQVIPMERFLEMMEKFLFLFWWKSEEHKVTSGWSQKVEISIWGLLRTVFQRKCEEHEVTSGWSQKVEISIWGLMRTVFQSIHFICMNNYFVSHEKALPTDPNCLPLIRKGLIRHVM